MIFFSALQFPSLMRDGVHVSFIDDRRFFAGGQQMRALQQAAEIFFAGDDFGASLARKAGVGFVFHFEPFEPDDADELSVFFPDLGLGEFHAAKMEKLFCAKLRRKKVCPSCLGFRRDNNEPRYFFLPTGFLAAAFFGAGLAALDLTAFLAMMFFGVVVSYVRNDWFPRNRGHHVTLRRHCK
jgi:hypothetical protein